MLPLEEAIHLMTDVQAELYGLKERGQVREGWYADVVVLDPNTIGTDDVAMRFDLPGGAGRLYAEATASTTCSSTARHRRATASSPTRRCGTLLRSGRDTATPSLV